MMHSRVCGGLATGLLFTLSAMAQPSIVETIPLGHSVVMVTTELPGGSNGRGSGVVVSKEYVATNCHVLANSKGANVAKFKDGYQPIALKANWRRDVCLLKFDALPFQPIPMRDSHSLQYEEEVFSLGFPAMAPVPQPSYGTVKAKYAYEGAYIVRTDASFIMGSSGGALFDQQFNLVGLTTFKSPGHRAFYYSVPVEWIKELMAAPETTSLKSEEYPFWSLPLEQRPYFMQVVIPYQNEEWETLLHIARRWTESEPEAPDAWYFLGVAEEGLQQRAAAKRDLQHATRLNQRDVDAMLALSRLAFAEKDLDTLQQLESALLAMHVEQASQVTEKIQQLKAAGS